MKAAIVTAYPRDPQSPVGGVESVSVNLVGALAHISSMDLHVVTTDPSCRYVEVTREGPLTVHRLPRRGRRVLTGAVGAGRRQMKKYLKELAPDVVHSHDVYGLMVKGLAAPRVFTVHGFIYGDTKIARQRWSALRWRLWKRVEIAGWADQQHVIAISPYVRERLAGRVGGLIHDIDNPVAESFFEIDSDERPGTIFSAALIGPRKNTLALVDAVALLVDRGLDVNLRLAGPVKDAAYAQQVTDRIRQLRLGEHVKMLGTLDSQQVADELARASVFALVSLEENSPMCIEEAMAAGLPIVASNCCGMPYMVSDGESGFLVDPSDPQDIAWRLGQLFSDDGLRASMGSAAHRTAYQRFHPTVVARRTVEVYKRAIGEFEGGGLSAER